jgi:hypothetical protein
MDPHDVAFPDPSEIAPHAIAFARMMFAHAAFEREVLVGLCEGRGRCNFAWVANRDGC